jgi:hypothetical protein
MATKVDKARGMGHPDVKDRPSRLAVEADDRAAQLAFAIETIRDEVGQVLRELAELHAAVDDQRIGLDELRTLQR